MQRIVFCDFDGTITAQETFVAMVNRFAPTAAAQILPKIYAQQLTLRIGVRQILEAIPSNQYDEIVEFAKSQSIRPGFAELLDFLSGQNIPFVIISGGLRCMVEAVTAPFVAQIRAIHAIDINTTGDYFIASSQFEGGSEMVAKVKVMASYGSAQTIVIGDGITDWKMAIAADVVFAKPPLIAYLAEQSKDYIMWNDFFDVRDCIIKLLD